MKLIIASNNKGKIKEFKEILTPMGYEVISQGEAGLKIEVEETGSTFSENAYLKAKAIYDLTDNCCVLADDSGLAVDCLDGEPGVYSARYGGLETEIQRSELVLNKMKDIPDENRTAKFICAICFIKSNGEIITVEGKCEGRIGRKPLGENGFGYDPIFMFGEKSFAQLLAEEKNEVSHRADAIKKLVNVLKG